VKPVQEDTSNDYSFLYSLLSARFALLALKCITSPTLRSALHSDEDTLQLSLEHSCCTHYRTLAATYAGLIAFPFMFEKQHLAIFVAH